jgi:uncharacterized protein YbjT (DUF2867 family)
MGQCHRKEAMGDEPKLIAIMGASGIQGGAIVRAFHEEGTSNYEVRAITRNPDSDKAKAIAPLVKEIVKADGDDEESMAKAFEGCYGAFIVTDFWQDVNLFHEMETTRTIQAAAKKAELKHVVLSTLPDTREFVNKAENKDTWKILVDTDGFNSYVPHFDGKGAVKGDFAAAVPTTLLETTFYYDNFINFGMGPAQHDPDQPYAVTFPMQGKKLSMMSPKDMGKQVVQIFKEKKTIGSTVYSASENLTCQEIAEIFTKVCGYEVVYNDVPVEVYATFPFPGAAELANMFRYYTENESEFCGNRDIVKIEELMGQPTTKFEDWVEENKASFAPKGE